jgi:LmbE family N-acetylglucosaminyl deacetylase
MTQAVFARHLTFSSLLMLCVSFVGCLEEPADRGRADAPLDAVTQALEDGCVMQVVAHQDDDLIFMNPDLLGDIRAGRCIRTVFITAGDAGSTEARGDTYWRAREAGARAAYATMAGVPDDWTSSDAGIPGHPITVQALQGTNIELLFMRLPDGCQQHVGCSGEFDHQSIELLWTGAIPTCPTVDHSSSYTRGELISVLRQLMIRFSPTRLRLQNYVNPILADGDHPDHHSAGYFGYEAQRGLPAPPLVVGYYGYQIGDQGVPANVSGELLTAKENAFLAYGAHDDAVCASPPCDMSDISEFYRSMLPKQYAPLFPSDNNALLRPRREAGEPSNPRIMIVGDSITHGNNGNQTWRYRLHEHLKSLTPEPDYVGPFSGPFTGAYPIAGWDDDHYSRWGCIAREIVFTELYGPSQPRCDAGHSMAERVASYEPDVMLVHLGSNDMAYVSDAAGLRDTMRAFIARAREKKWDIDIVFAQIGQVSLFGGAPRAAEFAPLIAELAAAESRPWSRINVAPVHPSWTIATDTDSGGTHPNVHGEFTIAKAFADTLHEQYGYGDPFGPIAIPPPKVTGIRVQPAAVSLGQPFTVSWPRVVNPGIWTTYRVQVRNAFGYGFKLIWESAPTPDLSVTFNGTLPQAGTYNIVVVSMDGTYETPSDPIPLDVNGGPPKVTGISIQPSPVVLGQPITVSWPRVVNPGIWTTYRVEIHNAVGYGFGLVWKSQPTPDLSVTYTDTLPQTGTYNIVVFSMDGTYETMSDIIPLDVNQGPPKVTGISINPSSASLGQPFTVSWPRVVNPGIWTTYKVRIHYALAYGFKLIWESQPTPNLSVTYDGALPQAGTYNIVVVSTDGTHDTPSDPVPLDVNGGPPKVIGVSIDPPNISIGNPFTVHWARVYNPGVWTWYRVEVHHHLNYGFGLVWRSPDTIDLSMRYGGPALDAGIYNIVVVASDGTYESMSDIVPLQVDPSDAAP